MKALLASEIPFAQHGTVVLDPGDPLASARAFVAGQYTVDGLLVLRHQGGVFHCYNPSENAYVTRDEASVRAELYQFLDIAHSRSGAGRYSELVPFKPTKSKVENVLDALRAECNLPVSVSAPCWLDHDPGLDPLDMVALRNGLLCIPARSLRPATPAFFVLNGLTFKYVPDATAPIWQAFLDQLWPADYQSQQTLQEWFGYSLTPRTKFQKILMLVGPKRSGKGTIGRVLRRLLGEGNTCGPTLAGLGEPFGLTTLINKPVAIIADARISGRTDTAVLTERLLSISGEDGQTIARKYLPDWNGRLPTRFMILTNELPRIEDSAGALASRFLVLMLRQSFLGREDHDLEARFQPELPGILNWALEGYDRLQARGRFTQPDASADLIREFEDLGSPIGAFLRDRCEVGAEYEVMQERVFDAWKTWCSENGREKPGTTQTLARNLRAALPWVTLVQHRLLGRPVRHWAGLRLKDADVA